LPSICVHRQLNIFRDLLAGQVGENVKNRLLARTA
jgi:hypothetical protein